MPDLNHSLQRTPFVLGTSSPPVRCIASRIASANALKADSALCQHFRQLARHLLVAIEEHSVLVVVVFAAEHVNVEGNTGSDRE